MVDGGWERSTDTQDLWLCADLRPATHLTVARSSKPPPTRRNSFTALFRQRSGSMVLYSRENTSEDHVSFNLQQYSEKTEPGRDEVTCLKVSRCQILGSNENLLAPTLELSLCLTTSLSGLSLLLCVWNTSKTGNLHS